MPIYFLPRVSSLCSVCLIQALMDLVKVFAFLKTTNLPNHKRREQSDICSVCQGRSGGCKGERQQPLIYRQEHVTLFRSLRFQSLFVLLFFLLSVSSHVLCLCTLVHLGHTQTQHSQTPPPSHPSSPLSIPPFSPLPEGIGWLEWAISVND